jgi:hypothetical protein
MPCFYRCCLLLAALVYLPWARAAELTAVHGVVHDPQHRPIAGATITLRAAHSDLSVSEKRIAMVSSAYPRYRRACT